MKKIRILTIKFNNFIKREELPFFRGAIIKSIDPENSTLFHNHDGNKLLYKYPIVQYKRINQKAAIVCIEEGTDAIGYFFNNKSMICNIGNREVCLELDTIKADQVTIQIWETLFTYRIRKWIPFNKDNYNDFLKLEGITEKSNFLEKILIGNILTFAKGINYTVEKEIIVKIIQIDEPKSIIYKDVKLMCFDLIFKTNLSLPNYIGLGKGVSLNNGVITKLNVDKN